MAFVNGLLLIDAPASALNNAGAVPGARTDNTVAVKSIRTRSGDTFPYVSAQAFRYWLRTGLEDMADTGWQSSPIFRETKVAYTDANPIKYWDDDLFGYMRAPSNKKAAQEARAADTSRAAEIPLTEGVTLTRAAPFRVATLVSIAPVVITDDFGTMSRHNGDPVPHEHQFYRTTLKGAFSLDLNACGTFSYRRKTGFRHLDDIRIEEAKQKGLIESEQSYRLPSQERIQRVQALFKGMARLEGGAKQSIHYTTIAPAVVILAVTKGGNNIFTYAIGEGKGEKRGLPVVNIEAMHEALDVFRDELLSPVYIGWARGFHDDERTKLTNIERVVVDHPRRVFDALIKDLGEHPEWME